jgi:LPS-assembly protein
VSVRADSQQKIGDIYKLRGHVFISYRDMEVRADSATYDYNSGEIAAEGHVKFTDPKSELEADEAHYNLVTEKGWFSNARGYVRAPPVARRNVMVTQSPFHLSAERVEALGENTYQLEKGKVSLCEDEAKGWSLETRRARLELDDKVVTRGTVFRFLGVPWLYAPVLVSSAQRIPRQTGFLIPQIGNSSQKGTILGEGFFWAINPSIDLLLGVENFSRRGPASSARLRARPSEASQLNATYFGVDDRGIGPNRANRAAGETIQAQGWTPDLGHGFRGVLDVNYINSLAFQSTWATSFTAAVTPEVRQTGFLTRNFDAYSLNFYVSRYQDFLSTQQTPGNSIVIQQTPSLSLSGIDKQLGDSPFLFAFDSSAGGMERVQPSSQSTDFVPRLDFHPQLTLRTKPLWGFYLTPSIGLRATDYGTSLTTHRDSLTRLLAELSVDLRPPSLEKILAKPYRGRRFKHVIEPDVRYRLVRAHDPQDISQIVRFDAMDALAETSEIEYSVTNLILMRKDAPADQEDTPPARELISLRLSQKYYFDPTFGGALQPGQSVVWEPTLSLTGFAFAQGRRLSPVVSVLKFSPFSDYDTEVSADVSPSGGVLDVGITSRVRRGDFNLAVTDFYVSRAATLIASPGSSAPSSFHLLRTVFTYGDINRKGLSGAAAVDYNFVQGIALAGTGQVGYNFGCFGLDIEYQHFGLGTLRRENVFRMALSLANVGSFGNLKNRDKLRILQ